MSPDRAKMALMLKSEDSSDEGRIIELEGFGRPKPGSEIMMDPAYKRLGYVLEAIRMAVGLMMPAFVWAHAGRLSLFSSLVHRILSR